MTNDEMLKVMATSQAPATVHCVDFAFRYLRAAETQVHRIWNREPAPIQPDGEIRNEIYQDILIDVHFYFISLRNLSRYLNNVVNDTAYHAYRTELTVLNDRWFSHYAKGREAFEHIDQRLPGEKYESRIAEIADDTGARRKIHYGIRPSQGLFEHSNEKWDSTIATFNQISADENRCLHK